MTQRLSPLTWLLRRYTGWLLRTRLEAVYVCGLERLRHLPGQPAPICAATHPSWWDGILYAWVRAHLQPGARVLTEQATTDRLPFLAAIGAIPIDRASALTARAGLRAARAALAAGQPVWIFPQGRIRPNSLRPLGIEGGFRLLARPLPDPGVAPGQAPSQAPPQAPPILPVAIHIGFRSSPLPVVFIHVGAPVPADGLEAALCEGLDRAERFLDTGAGDFRPLFRPAPPADPSRQYGSRLLSWGWRLLSRAPRSAA